MSAARRFACHVVEEWGLDGLVDSVSLLDTVGLLTSELVTNALLHARTETDVVVSSHDDRLRIEVHDGSIVGPSRKHYELHAGTGRGMLLVEALSAAWGCDLYRAGKVIWYELDVPDRSASSASASCQRSSQ